ncbi:MAG: ribosome silencing factor [Planctomycetes bacterium]|nr:ribosome silencing factor [Planctomycetota bacterium]
MPRKKKTDLWSTKELAVRIARLVDEKQAEQITILDVAQAIQVADYFVICEGTNRRHLKMIAENVSKELKKETFYRMGGSALDDENWVLLDFGAVVLHVFSKKARGYYDLENLWGDCKRLKWRRLPKKAGATEAVFAPRADVADDDDEDELPSD